jgi:hypothetical protein
MQYWQSIEFKHKYLESFLTSEPNEELMALSKNKASNGTH